MDFIPVEWTTVLSHLVQMGVAYALALPIGWDREEHERSAGLRTFPLVAVGACAYMLVGINVFDDPNAMSRVLYGIITGLGFIGGGAILKTGDGVTGTATAACIWNTGAVGIAVAWQRYDIAITLAAISFLTLRIVTRIKKAVHK